MTIDSEHLAPSADLPQWLRQSRDSAWNAFRTLPAPARSDEAWRFADLKKLDLSGFRPGDAAGDLPAFTGVTGAAAQLVFVNGRLASRHLPAASGLQILSMAEALASRPDVLQAHLTVPDTGLGGAKFAALHQAQLQDATIIIAPKDVAESGAVEIVHWISGEQASAFPRTIIVAEEGAKCAVIEHHLSAGAAPGFACGAAQISTARGAHVAYALVNRLNAVSRSIHLSTIRTGQDAHVRHGLYNLGGAYARTEARSHVAGAGSRCDMLGVTIAGAEEEFDQRTLQHHEAGHAGSDLLYKNVLFGKARTIFAGLIQVDEGAHFTDAYQKCRNLLMTEDCEANSMPGLEINADQVKCSHGSTSGQIRADEIFYFQSRGIPEALARQWIANGFTHEAVERLGHEAMETAILAAVDERFSAMV